MSDLTPTLLPRLQQHRLPGIDLGGEFIYPDYDGYSILNIPSSLCRFLGVPEFGAGPLTSEILAPLSDRTYRRVVLILMDALSLRRFQRWIGDGTAPVWNELAQEGGSAERSDLSPRSIFAPRSTFAPLASVVPSTTSAAITSLWTGRSPAEHGVVGYELWLKEYGVVANMLLHSPMSFRGEAGSLARAGFNPESFLPLPVLGTHLAASGVQTFTFQHYSILNSGLTQMLFKDVHKQAYSTATDLFVNLRRLFESPPADPFYAWVYWGEVDNFSHRYGPDDERTAAEFAAFSSAFERLFLSRLSPDLRHDTLLILTADHGSVVTTPDPYYQLRNYPSLARRLHILPTGEHRLMYLYVRPGQTEAVREVFDRAWPNQFSVIDPAYAVEAGLFGPGAAHPRLLDRLGDMIVVARDHAYLWWGEKEDHLLGRHGGLHPDEMLVPFLAAKLS